MSVAGDDAVRLQCIDQTGDVAGSHAEQPAEGSLGDKPMPVKLPDQACTRKGEPALGEARLHSVAEKDRNPPQTL